MDKRRQDLLARLAVGPSFLFLGQASGELATGADAVLAEAARRAGARLESSSLAAVGALGAELRTRVFSELADLTRAAEVPDWLAEVARHPWNGVFTSAIDGRVPQAFEADWRRVVTVVGAATRIRHPRSATELKVRMLFGGVVLPEEDQPPLDQFDLATRRREARDMLGELAAGLLTPRGLLAIEAYRSWDWLEPADLFALITQFVPGQVHLFSAGPDLLANDFVKVATERGALTVHPESLSLLLNEAEAAGRLVRPAAVSDLGAHVVRLGNTSAEIPRDDWNTIIGTARPIDESLLQPFPPASTPIRYQRFRAFLGSSEGAPPWAAIASGYHFERDFEAQLWPRVRAELTASDIAGPLILSGQAASGKSMALYALAQTAARSGEVAVLHVSRRAERPQFAAIARFALWAEEHGAAGTLLIWDGMADTDEYFAAHRRFLALGRRVLIVGTTYIQPERRRRTIIAPADLSGTELRKIVGWLASFDIVVNEADLRRLARDSSFLAALYRWLPESRRGLQTRLTLELRAAEAGMEQLGRERLTEDDRRLGVMADALLRAGFELPATFRPGEEDEQEKELPFTDRSTAAQLTNLVLVAGRRGLRIPLDLVLRILGREGSNTIIEIVKRFDIIRWSEDESGDQYLGPRTALEAELLARAALSDVRAEIEVFTIVLRELRPTPGIGGGGEVQFAVDLMARIGPDSEEAARYLPHYPQIIDALKELRSIPGRSNVRLVLLEANFSREYVKWAQGHEGGLPAPSRLEILSEAEFVLQDALDSLPEGGGYTRLNLLVELASTLGAQAYELSAEGDTDDRALQSLSERILNAAMAARAIDPENYYPVDVVAWVCMRLVGKSALGDLDRTKLIADTIASLQSVDSATLSPKQRARYNSKRAQLATLLGDPTLAEEHLAQLEQNGDPTAFYLLGLHRSGLLRDEWDERGARLALNTLLEAPQDVRFDWRCARLTLDLFWRTRTGKRFLRGKREALPFSRSDWEECLRVVDAIAGASTFDMYRADFLRGLALFHLGQLQLALSIFIELDRSTATLSRRVIATYVASTPEGHPARFTGQVRWATPDRRRGAVWVERLGIELPFIPIRFSTEPLEQGDALPEFQIAFNMRGPYADPIRPAQPRRAVTHG